MPQSQGLPHPVPHFIRAVEAEIKASLSDAGSGEKVALHSGRRVTTGETGGDTHEYIFACRSWKDSFQPNDVLIRPSRSNAAWEAAEVSRFPDGTVHVSTGADLGAKPGNAQLREDDTAALRALLDRMGLAGTDESPVNLTTAGRILGAGTPAIQRHARSQDLIADYDRLPLNPQQRRAVEQALSSDTAFIWGPPGTGKTEVVSRIVEGTLHQGLRTLFLAPTNVAVDQALQRVCELVEGEEDFDTGLVQRAGTIALPALSEQYGSMISTAVVIGRLEARFTADAEQVRRQLDTVKEGLALHEEAAAASDGLRTLSADQQRAEAESAQSEQWARNAAAEGWAVEQQISETGPPSGLFAKRTAARLDQLRADAGRHRAAAAYYQGQQSDAAGRARRLTASIAAAKQRFDELSHRLRGVAPVERLRSQSEDLEEQIRHLDEERRKVAESVRKNCRVMGATVSKAVQTRSLIDAVDVVVIDEAAMVDLPSAWCAAGLAGRRVIVAGDFRQLPAVTKGSGSRSASPEQQAHSRQWMDRDAFHAAGLIRDGRALEGDPRLVRLDTQYRMDSTICAVVNEVAYPDAPLVTGRPGGSRLPISPLIDSPLILVDTGARRMGATKNRNGAHKSNHVHEAVIHELIRGLQYDTVLPARKATDLGGGERPTDRMAVIAPYRDQVTALKRSLKYRFGTDYEGLVDTVHRFQGSQRPLVVIDTVAGAGQKPGYFYEGAGLSSNTCRLLNVALSRAQDHLVVVADVAYLRGSLAAGCETLRMLDHLEQYAQALSVDDLVPFRSAADLSGLSAEELARPAFFPADEVRRAVEWDIAYARTSIDVYCPFLDPNPVDLWLRRLAPRAAQGLAVTVHTQAHEKGTRAAHQVQKIEGAGCKVATRERMHEKVLIIDGEVLWHGSLNLMANTGPTDLMMRITDPDSCARVRHIVERARMERPARPRHHPASQHRRETSGAAEANGVAVGDIVGGRLYLNVPYDDKELAKTQVRARWDKEKRLWHVDENTPRDQVERWL
ncbi:phospholipase D-like protein [Murinocardiopsis flavida]|uniref:Phospholipase D-like protein n=1 Tax=Murinocardiopsis flavida TaxID=645275 RepID=A0A2P8DES0_9ACTN|nr:AAA domain-containing protein [Murinocardiopsis flavida]PSK95715.1 phospholipase D-like protein [Murinocardiopsis flavida]